MIVCKIGLHNWSKWSKSEIDYSGYARQCRICKDCGIIKWRKIGFFVGNIGSEINKMIGEIDD